MAYLKCPSCAQLARVSTDYVAVIHCPRCRALHKDVQLRPIDEPAEADTGPLASLQPGER